MDKFKKIAKDKRVITGFVVGIALALGVAIDPLMLDQIVNIVANLGN